MTISKSYYLIGGGGHAKVIARAIQASGGSVEGIFDDDVQKHGSELAGIRILGSSAEMLDLPRRPTVIAVGNNQIRKRISDELDCDWETVIHPAAVVDPTAEIGRGSVIMAGAIVQADSIIGDHGILNTGATVDHDCVVGRFCHIAPGANLAGHCTLGDGVLLGVGVSMIPSIRVGEWTTVGAGAAVVSDLPSRAVAVGVPARLR